MKPAAPIDAAQRPVSQKTDAPARVTAPPERLSTAHSQNSTGDPEMKFASDAKPQAVRAGADLTSPPIDPSSAKGSNADEKLASPIAPAAMGSSDEKSGASKSAAAGGAAGSSAAGSDSQLVMVPIGGVAAKPASGAAQHRRHEWQRAGGLPRSHGQRSARHPSASRRITGDGGSGTGRAQMACVEPKHRWPLGRGPIRRRPRDDDARPKPQRRRRPSRERHDRAGPVSPARQWQHTS